MPHCPSRQPESQLAYYPDTYWHKVIADYTGLTMAEVFDLDVIDYHYLKREAFIVEMSKTKEGQDYLAEAKLYETDEADFEGLQALARQMGQL